MSAEERDYLYLLAEIAIATVALSGIAMMLTVSGSNKANGQVSRITIQLRTSIAVTVLILLPLLLEIVVEEEYFWKIASAIYLIWIITLFVFGLRTREMYGIADLPIGQRLFSLLMLLSGLALLSLNLWLGVAWPYLVQATVGWIGSILAFLSYVYGYLSTHHEGT